MTFKWAIVAFPLALLTPATLSASDWVYVTSAKDDMEVYVDQESRKTVRVISQSFISAWVKWVSEKPLLGNNVFEIKSLFYFDCSQERSARMSTVQYDASGDVVDSDSKSYPSWTPEAPDTIGHTTLRSVCSLPQ